MAPEKLKYAPCPNCGALNMSHRRSCYKCHESLPAFVFGAPPVYTSPEWDTPEDINKRHYARRDVLLLHVMLSGEDIPRHEVQVRDISAGGMRIHSTMACRVGTLVTIEIPYEGRIHAVDGVVRSVGPTRDLDRSVSAVGVEFSSVTPYFRHLMDSM